MHSLQFDQLFEERAKAESENEAAKELKSRIDILIRTKVDLSEQLSSKEQELLTA